MQQCTLKESKTIFYQLRIIDRFHVVTEGAKGFSSSEHNEPRRSTTETKYDVTTICLNPGTDPEFASGGILMDQSYKRAIVECGRATRESEDMLPGKIKK